MYVTYKKCPVKLLQKDNKALYVLSVMYFHQKFRIVIINSEYSVIKLLEAYSKRLKAFQFLEFIFYIIDEY